MNEFEKYPTLAEHIREIACQGRFIPNWNGFLEKLDKALIEAKGSCSPTGAENTIHNIEEQWRWQYAGQAMQGLYSYAKDMADVGIFAEYAVKQADALIAELKKEKK